MAIYGLAGGVNKQFSAHHGLVSGVTPYGKSTQSLFGHCAVVNTLTRNSYIDGEALAAYQGYALDQKIATKASMVTSTTAPSTTLAANVLHCVYA